MARSQTAGWYCLTYWNSGDWLPSPQEILTAFLPAAAVLLLLILILSLVILQVIYRPIQRIVESMLTGQETEAGQDEAAGKHTRRQSHFCHSCGSTKEPLWPWPRAQRSFPRAWAR